jgi:hypothetical protein
MLPLVERFMDLKEVGQWFNRELVRKVGDEMKTLLWNDALVTSWPLMESFPHLFSLALSQDGMVGDLWQRNLEGERWRFLWRREGFVPRLRDDPI